MGINTIRLTDLLTKYVKAIFQEINDNLSKQYSASYAEKQTGELALEFAMYKIIAEKSGAKTFNFNKDYLKHAQTSINKHTGSLYNRLDASFVNQVLLNFDKKIT